jgi:hypothetical protein
MLLAFANYFKMGRPDAYQAVKQRTQLAAGSFLKPMALYYLANPSLSTIAMQGAAWFNV